MATAVLSWRQTANSKAQPHFSWPSLTNLFSPTNFTSRRPTRKGEQKQPSGSSCGEEQQSRLARDRRTSAPRQAPRRGRPPQDAPASLRRPPLSVWTGGAPAGRKRRKLSAIAGRAMAVLS